MIDDAEGATLAAASTLTPEIREKLGGSLGSNVEAAKLVGMKIAEICKERNIEKVCVCGWGGGWRGVWGRVGHDERMYEERRWLG